MKKSCLYFDKKLQMCIIHSPLQMFNLKWYCIIVTAYSSLAFCLIIGEYQLIYSGYIIVSDILINVFKHACYLLSTKENKSSISTAGLQHSVIFASEDYGLPLTDKIMPQWFQDLGYRTHMVGKVMNTHCRQGNKHTWLAR